VQFHPESAASQYGYAMLDRFLHRDRARDAALPTGADGVDGEESAHRAAEAQTSPAPWTERSDDRIGAFVPPPVELVR
jgi:hypothetical protein